jgi:D-3-phosphoglycerate dehydrogenase
VPYRVLISDKLAPEGIEILEQASELDVDLRPGLDPAELLSVIGDYEALIIRSGTTVTAEVIEAATSLKVIGRAGIGVDNVDVDAASKRGIVVMNTPGGNNVTTAEHTISMMLAVARHIPQAHSSLRSGEWRRSEFVGSEVFKKTLGIVGVGNIGSIVADRARGLRMDVLAYDPFLTEEAAIRLGVTLVGLEELFDRSDFISVHTPLTPKTRGLIGTEAFSKMRKGVYVVNCARGGIIDEAALAQALRDGIVAGAALDVFEEEPPAADNPLLQLPQVVSTPHLGASTGEAQLNVALAIAEQVRDFLVNSVIGSAVNVPSVSADDAGVLSPYIRLGERIGSLYAQLVDRAPQAIQIEFHGEVAGVDCRPVTAAVLKGLLERVVEPPVNVVNAPLLAAERGIKVIDLRDAKPAGFANSIRVQFIGPDRTSIVEGAVFGQDVIRIVRYDDFHFEVVPEGIVLVLNNNDVPGVVGNVGTLLANENVNIAGFALGRVGGSAVSLVHVDSPLDADQLEQLRRLPDITGANMVRFD